MIEIKTPIEECLELWSMGCSLEFISKTTKIPIGELKDQLVLTTR